jgi:DNA repair protein RAD5
VRLLALYSSDSEVSHALPGRLQDQDPCFRAVVFSQFTSFLDLIQTLLDREGLTVFRFDGSMDIKRRNAAVSEFRVPSRAPKVMIISLKAGGVGLNVRRVRAVCMLCQVLTVAPAANVR